MPAMIYQCDADGVFLFAQEGNADPKVPDRTVVPRYATLIAPPETATDQVARFDMEHGAWSVIPDRRGTTYWLADGSEHLIDMAGIALPKDALLEPPPPSIEVQRETALTDALQIVEQAGSKVVGQTPSVIVEGYTSKALDAQQMIAGATTDDIIAAEASVTGEDPMDLAHLVDAHAKPFRKLSGTVSGAHRVACKQIAEASDAEAIAAALETLKATCASALAELPD